VVVITETARERGEIPGTQDGVPIVGTSGRIASVDALRGLTILVMVFVNDLGPGAPSWMPHIQPSNADGMTLADVVFPAFLFIVGVSIPLAYERAQAAGKSIGVQLAHILTRTAGLLCMGIVVFNSEDHGRLNGPLWSVLAYTALILAWCTVPPQLGGKRTLFLVLKVLGAVGLLVLLATFRREPSPAEIPFRGHVEGWVWLKTGWWGILGLIGWAYLTVAILTLFLGRRREWLMGALAILMVLHLAIREGGLFARLDSKPWLGAMVQPLRAVALGIEGLDRYIGLDDATGSLAAITMAGCLLGTILRRDSDVATHRARLSWASTFAIGLLLAGLVTDTLEGINKNAATPTWCLWSAALTCILWILLYLLMDVAGLHGWSIVVRPAGSNPLVAYFLHPIIVELITLAGLGGLLLAYKHAPDPWTVVAGSLGMALFICIGTGLLSRLGLWVRL
jgi:predicted acyltransferase